MQVNKHFQFEKKDKTEMFQVNFVSILRPYFISGLCTCPKTVSVYVLSEFVDYDFLFKKKKKYKYFSYIRRTNTKRTTLRKATILHLFCESLLWWLFIR